MHALSSRRDSVDDNDKDFKKFYQKNEELNSPHTPKHTGQNTPKIAGKSLFSKQLSQDNEIKFDVKNEKKSDASTPVL